MLRDEIPLQEVRRALVVKLRHHGDVLLASPVLSVLKSRAPRIEIDALVYAETAPMLDLHPALNELHTIDRAWKRRGAVGRARAEWRLLRQLRARRYDLLVHLTDHWRGAWLARALRARWSVAPASHPEQGLWRSSFTHLVPAPRAGNRHTVEANLDALRRIGIHPERSERQLVLEPGDAARRRVAALLGELGLTPGQFVHLHPPSRWRFKCWNSAGWASVLRNLHGAGWRAVLTAAPDPAELAMVADVRRQFGEGVDDLSGRLSLKELAALSECARLFLGVDSAPMHVAAAMGTPVVALFGPSRESLWSPWGAPRRGSHVVLASNAHPCRPCELDGCGGGKVSDCLVSLQAEQVWQAVSLELQRAP